MIQKLFKKLNETKANYRNYIQYVPTAAKKD